MAEQLIQVFEYEKLRYDEHKLFKKSHFERLVRFNEQHDNKYFTVIHKGVKFQQYVGVLRVGSLTIEILPKVDRNSGTKQLWQSVLIHMLRVANHITIDTVSESALQRKYHSVLEVYIARFMEEMEQLIRLGLIKKYQRINRNRTALKGKLLVEKQIRENFIHKERFFCESDEYNKDHKLHQILFQALQILQQIVMGSRADRLNRICIAFGENYTPLKINTSTFKRITLNRKTIVYKKALQMAEMFLLNYSPHVRTGSEQMLTLLFDMNDLWEEYIYKLLARYRPDSVHVSFQNKKVFWQNNAVKKSIRPDIVLTEKNSKKTIAIIDTKWKNRENNQPDDSDLKQMFAYNLLWNTEKSILLYPRVRQSDSEFGEYQYPSSGINNIMHRQNLCKLAYVDLFEDDNLRSTKSIAVDIFSKLNEQHQ